jgi:hypothetical protein
MKDSFEFSFFLVDFPTVAEYSVGETKLLYKLGTGCTFIDVYSMIVDYDAEMFIIITDSNSCIFNAYDTIIRSKKYRSAPG